VAHRIELAPPAQRDLRRLPPEIRQRLHTAILSLAREPRPPGVRKIEGQENAYRVGVGAYRIVYDVYDRDGLVLILRVSRRTERTYRRLP
jgi:mRNA interferase RelE/StbE